jgi:hypothetical protein
MKTYALATAAPALSALPAFSAEYYIVRGPDKKCKIVETKPVDTTIVQVGPLAFKTRDDAEREIRVVCKEDYSDGVVIKEKVR